MVNNRSDARSPSVTNMPFERTKNAPYLQTVIASGGRATIPSYGSAAGWPQSPASVTYGFGNSEPSAPEVPDWSAYPEPMMSNVHSTYPEISMHPNFAPDLDSSWAQIPSQSGFLGDSLSSNQYQQDGFPIEDASAMTSTVNHMGQRGPDRDFYQSHLGSNQTHEVYECQGRVASGRPPLSGQIITHTDPAAMLGQAGPMVLDNQDMSCLTSDSAHSTSTESSPASTGTSLALPTNTNPRRSKLPSSICPYPGCQAGFSGPTRDSKSNLNRHIRYQHGQREKPRCPEVGCNKEYTREDNLRQHLRSKHGYEPQPQRINAPRAGVASDHNRFLS